MCNFGIFTILAYLSPSMLRTRGIFRTLSNIYDGPFTTDPCVILAYSEVEAYSQPCQISMIKSFIQNHE